MPLSHKNLLVGSAFSAGVAAILVGVSTLTSSGKSTSEESTNETATLDETQAPSNTQPAALVKVEKAISTTLTPYSEIPGSIISTRDSLIAATTSGRVDWVAEVGTSISKGDIIARIDPVDAQVSRDEAAAEVERLRANANYLASLYTRYASLGDEAAESEASLERMKTDRDVARQNLASARLALQRAEINLERTNVRAPFSGKVVSRSIQIGEYATPGIAVARLVDTKNLEVTAQAPSHLLNNIATNDNIDVLSGQTTLISTVRAVVPVGNEISRTMELRLSIPSNEELHIGTAVRVKLPAQKPRQVVAAPRDALVLRTNRISVFTINDDNIAKRIDIELGTGDGSLVEVIGDIAPGDRLVIRGGERLRDGQKVDILDTEPQKTT